MTSSTLTFSLLAIVLCLAIRTSQGSPIKAAPYYMPFENDPQDIDDIVSNSGIRHFIFAFALATNDGDCVPTWDGNKNRPVAQDTAVLAAINKVRSHGGDISISFGGYNGVELGHVCTSPEVLANAYQQVIDKYALTHVDFDIEGDDLGPADEESRRFQAIKILKQNALAKDKELHVTLTLPCTIVGLSELGKAEIGRGVAVQQNLVDLYKIMAFDYGGPGATQVESVIQVMEMIHTQLKSLRTDLTTDAQVYAHTGMILMNGHTDQASELYTQDTFSRLIDYANQKKLGRVSYWALNRDRPCPNDGKGLGWVAGHCSSVAQQPWEFTKIIAKFNPGPDVTEPPVTQPPVTQPPVTQSPVTQPQETLPSVTQGPVVVATQATPANTPVDCSIEHVHEQYYPYNGDCHRYIRCFGGQAHIETCPADLLYDLELHICNWAVDVHRPECK